jgi:hypothetical protein
MNMPAVTSEAKRERERAAIIISLFEMDEAGFSLA